MRPLQLDYVAPPARSRVALLVLAAGMAAAAGALWQLERLRGERAQAELALERARAVQVQRAGPAPQRAQAGSGDDLAAAGALVRRIRFPWHELFGALEGAGREDVALIGVEPDAGKGLVRVTAEARTPRGMLDYVRRLERSTFLEGVELQKHEMQVDDPVKPLRFTVLARWKDRD